MEDDEENIKLKFLLDEIPEFKKDILEYHKDYKDKFDKFQVEFGKLQDRGWLLFFFIVLANICTLFDN